MNKRTLGAVAAGAMAFALVAGPAALAHPDSPDSGACDTWSRADHTHDHSSSNDTNLGAAYIHNHGGHYSASTAFGYVEVLGGQGYNQGGNQGGAVQGEVDSGGGPDADFSANSFAGSNAPYATGGGCVNVLDIRVG